MKVEIDGKTFATTSSERFTMATKENAMSTLAKAIAFAADKHADQTDKGGNAYILHPPPPDVARNANLVPLYDAAALATARRQALEDAARVCEEVIEQDNESAYQAAAGNCADAIRALINKDGE